MLVNVMSTPQPLEIDQQASEAQALEIQEGKSRKDVVEAVEAPAKKQKGKGEPLALTRELGRSLLPFSRVQKIIKADKDIPIVAKDATFLISLAAEEFIKRLGEAAHRIADREKRATVQHRDIATVVRKADEFLFLGEIIPWTMGDPPARRKPKTMDKESIKAAPTLLDQFIVPSKKGDQDMVEQPDIVMNEDGTMYVEGIQEDY